MVEIKKVESVFDLEYLNENDAIVIEGITEDTIGDFVDWVNHIATLKNDTTTVYKISGGLLDMVWGLTGDNRYDEDLNIVAIPFSEIESPELLAIPRFAVCARWWSDVRDNNLRREEEKRNG